MVQTNLFSVEVKLGGKTLREYIHNEGIFICGPKGESFSISLRNKSARRTMAVISVDGLCIIDGLEMLDQGLGYIIEPGQESNIDSWRFNTIQCPQFHFGYKPPGFETMMDRAGNLGVIEIAFFYEQANPHYSDDWLSQSGFRLGSHQASGWFSKKKSEIVREQFAREDQPVERVIIQYEDQDALEKMGIELH